MAARRSGKETGYSEQNLSYSLQELALPREEASTKSQSYQQSNCHVDDLKGDLPGGCPVCAEQLVGWSGKQSVALTQLESISGKY